MINKRLKKSLFVIPVTVYPQGNVDSSGDRVAGVPFTLLGYIVEELIVLDNVDRSTRQIYLAEQEIDLVANTSSISCLSSNKVKILKKQVFYGRDGKILFGVIYIP